MTKKTFSGGVPATQLSGALSSSATSFTVSSATGYPSGSGGPFVVCIDRGTASEEKILISSVASTTFTVASGGRGYDGTTATTHSSSATVEHVLDAITIAEANDHVNTTSRDDHTQYLTTGRHDITGRHAFGAALGTPGTPASVGTSASAGTGSVPARADHVHVLGADSVTTASIAAGAVTTAKLASGAVDSAALGANAVTSAKIATDAVTSTQIAADAVGASEIATGAVGSDELAANAVIAGKLANGAVDTTARLADGIVSRPKLATGFTGITVGSAPSSPTEGELWYDTTNHAYKQYTTATTGWVAPWNLPWGAQAYTAIPSGTSQTISGGTLTAISIASTALSATATLNANRRYRVTAFVPEVRSGTNSDEVEFQLRVGTTTYQRSLTLLHPTNGNSASIRCEVIVTGLSGSTTFAGWAVSTTSGTLTLVSASISQVPYILIEDIGPAGAFA